ncbi:MAG TPA: hypothetical protein ENH18_04225 [Nitrospirae bacterium]|nr:hypothetical protein [Nitrospirota bacterium]HEW81559.1 hypothetical protein [Nitrospirota bacterium]
MNMNLKILDFLKFAGNIKNTYYKEGRKMKNKTNIKEVKIMRKMIMILFFVVLSVVLIQGNADAKITGKACSTCHTMHNSQNGDAVDSGGPFSYLLKGYGSSGGTSCWGCHTDSSSAVNVDATIGAPLIEHAGTAADLAGGNFGYITGTIAVTSPSTTSNVGHNVTDTGVTDSSFTTNYPPGDEYSQTFNNTEFTCAGVNGCHGDRAATDEYTAVKGAHHFVDDMLKFGGINEATQAQTTGTNGTKVGSSYRFLKGVKGGEDADWEGAGLTAIKHNEYKGATSPVAGLVDTPGGNTISGLCNECHGNFHGLSAIGGSILSPFTRHPADIVLPTTGDYAGYTSYNTQVPIARTTIPTAASASNVTNATIMCLSCHRAHASAYPDMLRWDYTKMLAGNAATADRDTGCFACHTGKDGN